jgi:hypothetical protein
METKNQHQIPPQQINIELSPEQGEGIYSNLALITHSPAEFVFDFTRILPGVPKTKVYARIIMTPQHAKSFWKALEENIQKFEAQNGEIKLQGLAAANKQIGFKPPTITEK